MPPTAIASPAGERAEQVAELGRDASDGADGTAELPGDGEPVYRA